MLRKDFHISGFRILKLAGGGVLLILMVLFCLFQFNTQIQYQTYDNTNISYNRAAVFKVTKESLELIPNSGGRYLGKQEIVIRMKTGPYKGEQITLQHSLSTTHNVHVKTGQSLIIRVESVEGGSPYFSVYNYDRTPGMIAIVLAFFVLTVSVGGLKGLRSVIGLLFTLFFILAFMLPAIYNGYSPVWCSIITVVVTTGVNMIVLNGFSKKTMCAVVSTMAGVMMTGAFFSLISFILHISGYTVSETEELLLISGSTGMKIQEVLFAGALISSLGAVMDTSLSLASALLEIQLTDPARSFRQLFSSGINIGKDMIGTMTNTLILAFVGSALVTLLVLISYGVAFDQLMSSDYIAVEIAHGIAGSTGIVLSVPLTSLIAAWVYSRTTKM